MAEISEPVRLLPMGSRNAAKYRRAVRENQEREEADRNFRQTDPVERAKTWLRRRGAA